MQPASSEIKIQSLLLRQIMQQGQKAVADALGIAESHLSRWLSGESGLKFEQYCRLLVLLTMEINAKSEDEISVTISSEYLQALKIIARTALAE